MTPKLEPNFSAYEFCCGCGCGLGVESMREELLHRLIDARYRAAIRFVINSAVRCPAHNAAVGGVESSAHLGGYAVDIAAISGAPRYRIVCAALAAGFSRIGVGSWGVHLDCDPDKPADRIWVYAA